LDAPLAGSSSGYLLQARPNEAALAVSEIDNDYIIAPQPDAEGLSSVVSGIDQSGAMVETRVVTERPLTLYLNRQEIVTMMTIGDHPDLLAIGYLRNQNMLDDDDVVTAVDYDEEVDVVVVRTERDTDYEAKLQKKVRTSGCAQGTVFGDMMAGFDDIALSETATIRTSWLYELTKHINTTPSLYLAAGAIHGCVLCHQDRSLVYMEDVGRHNAVDKIAGWMWQTDCDPADKIFYTTGRLTSEMVIKTVMMGIPILVSRSGFTAWGVELARRAGLTLIGRARGRRFVVLSGEQRLVFDAEASHQEDEPARHRRKGGLADQTEELAK
jgi:FdhD protein